MPRRSARRHLGRADVHAAVELHGVGVDDLGGAAVARERLGEIEGERRLAGAGRADDRDERSRRLHRDAQCAGRRLGRPMLTAPRAPLVRTPARGPAPRTTRPRRGRRRRRRACDAPAGCRRPERRSGSAAPVRVTTTLTTSPGRGISLPAGTSKCTRRPSSERPDMRAFAPSRRPSPAATSTSTVGADQLRVLFARDALLQLGQTLVALLHDLLRHLIGQRRGRGAGADRVLEGVGRRRSAPARRRAASRRSPLRSRRGSRR